jgi:hypothetical protein
LDTEFVGMLVLYNQPFNWRFLFPNPSSCEVSLKSCVKSPGTQLPISVSCPRQAHRQRRPCYLYAFAGAGDLQPGWRPMDRHGLDVDMIYMEKCQLLRHKDGSVQDCSLTRWICSTC